YGRRRAARGVTDDLPGEESAEERFRKTMDDLNAKRPMPPTATPEQVEASNRIAAHYQAVVQPGGDTLFASLTIRSRVMEGAAEADMVRAADTYAEHARVTGLTPAQRLRAFDFYSKGAWQKALRGEFPGAVPPGDAQRN